MLSKKVIAVFMALLMFCVNVFAVTPDFNLSKGTALTVRVVSPIRSNGKEIPSAIVGNDVHGSDGKVLIKRGETVQLQIEKRKAKGCGKAGYVKASCISTTAVDGQNISLNGVIEDEGEGKRGLSLGLGIGLGLTFLPIVGFAFFAIKGKKANIETNTLIPNVVVMEDYAIR